VNCRFLIGATIPAVFLIAPVCKAQTIPTAPDAGGALIVTKDDKVNIGVIAPEPFRNKGLLHGNQIRAGHFNKKPFLVLSASVYAAGLADMHQTLYARRYSWWYEKDPLAKSMVRLPAPAYYATGLALATGLNWLSWKMGHSRKWHRFAPIPQLLAIAGNTYGLKSNRYQNYQ
jgi:hypothetical protein